MRIYFVLLVIFAVSSLSNASESFNISVISNQLDQDLKSYRIIYRYLNSNFDNFEYHLTAKDEAESLLIEYKSINLTKDKEVSLGVNYFPKTNLKSLQIEKKNNGVMFNSISAKNAVMRLHGSEGGVDGFAHAKALFMALNGFASYAYCYFNCPFKDAPSNLYNVEVKRVYDDLVQLKRGYSVALWGGSRGAELVANLADFLASNDDLVQADAYIADRPAHIVVPAYFYYYQDPSNWKNGEIGKQPIEENWIGKEDGPHIEKQGWIWSKDENPFVNYRPIQVENSQRPYLNIHGTADKIWPVQLSLALENRVEESVKERFVYSEGDSFRLSNKQFQFHYFNDVGHAFKPKWAQILRDKVSLDFLNQSL